MALTRDFKETVKARVDREPGFRQELLREALQEFLNGELDVAKLMLRDFINATDGFKSVGKAVNKEPKSLMRMFGAQGNPNARNLLEVTSYLQQQEGLSFTVVPNPVKKSKKKNTTKKPRKKSMPVG